MADKKISEFDDGGAIQTTDEVATNRGGVNTKVAVGSSAALDVGTGIGDIVQLEDVGGNPGLPAVGGSQLTGVSRQATVGFTISGSPVATGKVSGFFTANYAGTISGWSLTADAGTATMRVWKIANGTAKPTVANNINTSGVSLSSGTHVRSTTVTDFTTTAVTLGDVFAFELTAVSGVSELSGAIEITRSS